MSDALGTVLAALSDATRRSVVERLLRGPATPGELAKDVTITAQGLSRHLAVLEGAGLIYRTREGQRRPCHLDPAGLRIAASWIDQNRAVWEARFERLEKHVANKREKKSD
ncbi:metalloregulator ArsR/SmtB family transcription factor [Devosia sp. ZB163]|uniref:ArsR/SmtB family transcription factor n=1 Tax=Devosia sp. ZB163 TaxID=3025938 RepID=UPI00235E0776|nr:metalloregulator ArsR/SmtB family transcription factor [Devosia sp. ZB163]MDC9823769.1 metalloregulator ArsR/SmtB family transcription factor [Devosia sp. ZB163]